MSLTASATDTGARYVNDGNRIMTARSPSPLPSPQRGEGRLTTRPLSPSPLWGEGRVRGLRVRGLRVRGRSERPHGNILRRLAEGRLDDLRLGEREDREPLGAEPRRLPLPLALHGFRHLLGRDRRLVDPHADRVVDS